MRIRSALILAAGALLLSPMARSGHEMPVYPSYYPHEIDIAAVAPREAGEMLGNGKLHAYVGHTPSFGGAPPKDIASVASLGTFVVVKLNPGSALAKDEASACGVVAAVARELAARGGDVVAHPYPVTPLHGDYLTHADLAETAKVRFGGAAGGATPPPQPRPDSPPRRAEGAPQECGEGLGVGGTQRGSDPSPPTSRENRYGGEGSDPLSQSSPPCPSPTRGEGTLRQAPRINSHDQLPSGLKLRAESTLAQSLTRPEWRAEGSEWDAVVQEVDAGRLVASAMTLTNGWIGPRWVRAGWFHAYRLLADTIADPQVRKSLEADVARLQSGEVGDPTERANLERDLVRRLTADCRGAVAGYTLRREYFRTSFSEGIENIAYDALEGIGSPMFLRTVKLKDFPWNGWLKLGIDPPPKAAWNPVGGFSDDFGRLMWFAIGDPAAIPSPNDHGWVLNRISDVEASPKR